MEPTFYVPKANGNRDVAMPAKVEIKPISNGKRRRYKVMLAEVGTLEASEAACRECVGEVFNMQGDGINIIDGRTFAEHADDATFFEVAGVILDPTKLTEGDANLQQKPSDSSAQETAA